MVNNFVKNVNGVNKSMIKGIPINANKSFKTFDAKYVNTNITNLSNAFCANVLSNPRSTSGSPKNNAVKAAGTVNKLMIGSNPVNKPFKMIGNKNNGASSKNGSPPNSARNKPTINAAIAAGIKLNNPLSAICNGNKINLSANLVRNVPINETNGKLIHVNGFKNASGPKIGANSSIPANQTRNGTTRLIIESTNIISGKPINRFKIEINMIINGAKKIVSIIKLKNGIKLGNANNANATNGNCNDSSNNPRIETNPNAPSARMNGNPIVHDRPINPNTNGATMNKLNKFNNNSGNPNKLNNVN